MIGLDFFFFFWSWEHLHDKRLHYILGIFLEFGIDFNTLFFFAGCMNVLFLTEFEKAAVLCVNFCCV